MSYLFLTKEELIEMTKYVQYKKQREYLHAHGYKFDVDRYGQPLVLKSHIEALLGGFKRPTRIEPDIKSFKKYLGID